MNSHKSVATRTKFGRRFTVLQFLPPWKDVDGLCIAAPDPNYKHKFTLCGMHCTNEECVEWLKAIAGPKIVWLGENKFEFAELLPARTIAEWAEWEVGKAPWELMMHGSDVTLYFHDYFAALMKSLLKAFDERVDAHLDALVKTASQEIDALCAKALQRIELFS